MDSPHKHANHAAHWFMTPCLVHITLLLIYLQSLKSQHLEGVYLSRQCAPISFCACVEVHMFPLLFHLVLLLLTVCVCMPVSFCICVWTAWCLTWQEVTFPLCSSSYSCHGMYNPGLCCHSDADDWQPLYQEDIWSTFFWLFHLVL